MPRDKMVVRRRLQQSALELFSTRGYDQTTASDIAEHAGVTERTFFRHFPDKREVLFDGENLLIEILVREVCNAPVDMGSWEILFHAFCAAEPLFVGNRQFSQPRQSVINDNPALQERELTKSRSIVSSLTSALSARGLPQQQAALAAQVGWAALAQAFTSWIEDAPGGMKEHLVRAFREVSILTSIVPVSIVIVDASM